MTPMETPKGRPWNWLSNTGGRWEWMSHLKQISGSLQNERAPWEHDGDDLVACRLHHGHHVSQQAILVCAAATYLGSFNLASVVHMDPDRRFRRGKNPHPRFWNSSAGGRKLPQPWMKRDGLNWGRDPGIAGGEPVDHWNRGIGTHPLVVSNKLHNVPERGYWGWDDQWSFPYHPETWYLTKD